MNEYIIEFYPLGNSIKVSAIDPVSLKEATIVGPVGAEKKDLVKLAVNKLNYLILKDQKM